MTKVPKIYGPYGDKPKYNQHTGGESMTVQDMAGSCDINNIMKKYERTGLIEHLNTYNGDYSDFSGAPDFQTAMNKVIAAQEMFMTLPASTRELFGNDPGKFVEFASNKENLPEMREMGLAHPEGAPEQPQTAGEGAPDKAPKAPKKASEEA
jgi:phage internal scaffolding protein